MQNFVRNLLTEWRGLKLPFAGETFIAAVSGGADSVSLLLALRDLRERRKLNLRIVVAHYNHNLRGEESDRDENFVKVLAGKFGFELAFGRGNPANAAGNLEQNAREARYEFLAETAENLDAYGILTAHTLNDQAETFLFNMLRGSGLDGLGGMKTRRRLELNPKAGAPGEYDEHLNAKSQIQLIRPLLNWAKREDTENFCRLNHVDFRSDSMNEDLKYSRVRIRKILIPLLKEFNPKIIETLAQTARLLREDAELLAVMRHSSTEYIKRQTGQASFNAEENPAPVSLNEENILPPLETADENLRLSDLKDIFPSMRRAVLRDWLKNKRGNLRGLELKHIEAVEKLLFSRKSGRIVELPAGESVLKKDGKLHFRKTKVEK